jgi:spore coat protein A, manganese oxidase
MKLTRRHFLKVAGGAAFGLLGACGGESGSSSGGRSMPDGSTGALLRSAAPPPTPFSVPLPIPPVLAPVRRDATTDYYELTQRSARLAILPGLATEVWGYDGLFPGPTIEARRGRRVVVRHRNTLAVPTVVHLHGAVAPPDHDGYPTDLLLPEGGWSGGGHGHAAQGAVSHGSREYSYPNDQPAATLWYHDHRMDFTGPQVYRGLAGFHLIRDDAESALPLPAGERDIPLMICDRAFAADGAFMYPSIDPSLGGAPGVTDDFRAGVLGDVNLVNGAPWPVLEVTNTRYRFRILNASNARNYRLVLDPPPAEGAAFVQIGSDAGLLGHPIAHDRIEIAPAERFEVVVDFAAYPVGTQVTLVNRFVDGPLANVMRFHVVRAARDDSGVPAELVAFEALPREAAVATREFNFAQDGADDMWTINGEVFDPGRIDASPSLGTTEIWRITSGQDHPFHLHLAHFQVLRRGRRVFGAGGAGQPGPYDAGWKDTVYVPSSEQVEVIARFAGYRGKYVFHCHNLEHEDMMMMANFEVV